jgi:hypothetical protein
MEPELANWVYNRSTPPDSSSDALFPMFMPDERSSLGTYWLVIIPVGQDGGISLARKAADGEEEEAES